jgi:transposase
MARGELTNEQWQRIEPFLPPMKTPGKPGRGYTIDHRTSINGMLWILRTGAPWRDLPEKYGPYSSCHDRLTRFKRKGIWQQVLQSAQCEAEAGRLPGGAVDWEGTAGDSTTIKAHPHAAGARKNEAKKGGLGLVRRRVHRNAKTQKMSTKIPKLNVATRNALKMTPNVLKMTPKPGAVAKV